MLSDYQTTGIIVNQSIMVSKNTSAKDNRGGKEKLRYVNET